MKNDELRKLAEAATPGPHHIYTNPRDDNNWKANRDWHEAATPAKIIELLDTIEQQRMLLNQAIGFLGARDLAREEVFMAIINHLRQQEGEKK